MKIIFFGTSDFAVSALKALSASGHQVLKVVTAADKRQGRGQVLSFSPVKIFARKIGLSLLQPKTLRDKNLLKVLKSENPDLFVVAAYGKILTKEILQIPGIYAINLHASLLPKYRGAAPVNWAIIKGEKVTGLTIFKMDECMDTGQMLLQEKVDISFTDTSISLSEKLGNLAAQALPKSLELIERKAVKFSQQDESRASSAPKLKKDDGLINWQDSALEIYNRVRGLQPWPSAFTYLDNKLLKIWQSQIVQEDSKAKPGEIVDADTKRGILVQTGKQQLLITMLQLEGKKKMPAGEFILGHNIETGKKLGR